MQGGLWRGVTAEYPAIWCYTPEKTGYMDTQLSPAYGHTCLVLATRLRSSLYLPSPLEYVRREKSDYA